MPLKAGFLLILLLLPWAAAQANDQNCGENPNNFSPAIITYDLSANASYCELCGIGQIRILLTNSSTGEMDNFTVTHDFLASGLEYVAGSTTYSVDGGVFQAGANPTVAGTQLTWASAQIAALANIPSSNNHSYDTVEILFNVQSPSGSEEALVSAVRNIQADVAFTFCPGTANQTNVNDTTGIVTLPIREPVPTVAKLGRNVDAAQGGYSDPVYGNTNDDIIWRIEIGNGGLAAMQDLKFNDLMTAGNMSVDYACPTEGAALAVANNNGADPGGTGCVAASNSITNFAVEDPFGEPGIPADVAPGGITRIYLAGKVTSSCNNQTNTVSNVEWGCVVNNPAGGITNTSTGASPGSASSTLSTLVTNNGLQIQRQITGTNTGQPVGAKGTVTITITNNSGGTVKNIQLNDVLPTGPTYYVVDSTFTPTIAVTPAYGAYAGMTDTITWTNPNGDPLLNTSPAFTLTSSTTHANYADQVDMLRNDDVLIVTFRIVMVNTTYYDKQADLDVREELAGTDDPANMPVLNNQLFVTFEQFCTPGVVQQGSSYPFNDNFTPSPEDIDIDITGTELIFILTNDQTQRLPLRVQLTNNGGHDAADHFTYASFGETMSVVTAPAGCAVTTNPPPRPVWNLPVPVPATATIYECTSGVIAPGATRNLDFEVIKNLASAADDLTFRADVVAEVTLSDTTPLTFPVPSDPIGSTVNNYSLDGLRARVIGFNLQKSQSGSCTENNPPPSSPDTDVQIGEQCTFQIDTGGWFGFLTPGFTYIAVQDIQVVDELPDGQGYISSSDPTATSDGTILGISLNPPTLSALDEGWVDWTFNRITPAERIMIKDQWFRVDISTRILNDPVDTSAAPNQHAANSTNVLNSTFQAVFQNGAVEEVYSLGASTVGYPQQAIRRVDLVVTEPNLQVVKEACNETLYGVGVACSNFVTLADDGDTNDSYVYRIRLTNQASSGGVTRAPAYNVTSTDVLDASDLMLIVQSNGNALDPFENDGLDNDGDGLVDGLDGNGEGTISDNTVNNAIPAQITFSHTHSAPLLRVDPGSTVTFYYRVDPDDDIAPLQSLINTVTMTYDSLEGDFGSQSAPQRLNGDIAGARVYTSTAAQATVQILPLLAQPKAIIDLSNTPVGGPPQPVSIGEEVRYELTTGIPVAQLRSFVIRDELPAGVRCIEAPDIDLGAGVYAAAGFVPGGTFTPTCANTGTNDYVQWDFGDQELTTATGTRFTFPVNFIARFENTVITNDTNVISNGAPATNATVTYIDEGGGAITLNFASNDAIVSEPQIALTKTFSAANTDAGDVLTVTVAASNTGSATAYNLRVMDDLAGTKLTFLNSVGGTDQPDTIDTTTLGANAPIFSWNATNPKYSIAPGGSISFTFTVSVDIDVEPEEILSNTLQTSWQSLPDLNTALNSSGAIGADGGALGMRNGAIPNAADAINDYETTATATIPVLPASIAKTRLNDTYSVGADVRIGDIVEYELRLTLPEGTTAGIVLSDVLPQGLQYEATVSVNSDTVAPYTSAAPFTHADFAGAGVAGSAATGPTTVTWTLGQVVNDGDNNAANNDLVIVYRARVLNLAHPQVNNIALINTVGLDYSVGGSAAPTLTANETIDLLQPNLTVSKVAAPAGGDTVLDAGEIVTYTVDIANTGTAPAYDAMLQDLIPVGLRNGAATITVTSITLLNGPVVLPNLTPAYDAGTGIAVWNFDAGIADRYTIPAGDTLRVVYQLQAEPDLGAAMIMTNQAQVQNYYSFDDEAVPSRGGTSGVREIYGPGNVASVTLTTPGPNPLDKQNPAVASVTIGETFTYRITVPNAPLLIALHDVVILDDLSASAADLTFIGVSRVSGSQTWTPVNSGTASSLVIEDTTNGIDIPAGEQIQIDITVRLGDTGSNIAGLLFSNTAGYRFNQIDGDIGTQLNGGAGATPNMTVVEPDTLTLVKTGPVQVQFGTPATFTVNVQNTGTSKAWDLTITGQLPNTVPGGMCDTAPATFTAGIYLANGTTLVSALVEGTDYVTGFNPAPACALTFTMQSATAAIDPTNRLIMTYQATPDNDNIGGASMTNIAGATQWYSLDTAGAGATGDTRTYTRVLTDGTPSTLDHEDAFTVSSEVPVLEFRKTVINMTTGQDPGANALPGDTLRYRINVRNVSNLALANFSLTDEVDRLTGGPTVFAPGTLNIITVPGGADTSNTSVTGGTLGTGLLDVRNLNLDAAGGADSLVIEFDITLAAVITNGTVVLNQAEILIVNYTTLASDDPNTNGADDPVVLGDEDATRTVTVGSAPVLQVQKVSQDLTGDLAVLDSGDTLRYTITVKDIGNENAVNTTLRDQIPANTSYVANSTRLNGAPVADPSVGVSALQDGFLINAPENTTPGFMRADSSATLNNVATITFDVTINDNVINGSIISNQGFVNGDGAGSGAFPEQPSDDPATPAADDPTIDIVGSLPLVDSQKTVQIIIDNGTPGTLDPGDTLRYTISVTNFGAQSATGVVLTDAVPANTTYVADSVVLNTLPVGQPDAGISPLIAGVDVSSSDLTPPMPTAGNGTLSINGTATITFDVQVNAGTPPGTVITNQGTVISNEQAPEPTDADGNDSNGDQPTQIVVGNAQQLAITKSVSVVGGGVALAGGELEYVVQVTNIGSIAASDVLITDNLDLPVAGQVTYVAGFATLNSAMAGVSFAAPVLTADYGNTYGALAPGASAILRFRVQIDATLPIGTTLTNTAQVTWNAATQNNADSVSIDVGGTPGYANLNGNVWHDANFDNTIGGSERHLQNWTVAFYRNTVLVGSVLTDANGVYRINGLAPNDVNGYQYELRFRAPGAGVNTAMLGLTDSIFTDGQQSITNIVVGSGSNTQSLNLPIEPSGVVYNAIVRVPVAGATVSMLRASTSAPLPDTCFDDPAQQNQVTLADGFYKFDINFSEPACNNGDDYMISVTPPLSGYATGESLVIPASSNAATPPFSVPNCLVGVDDAVPATANHCEVQTFASLPPLSIAARSTGTNYHLQVTLDNGQIPGESQLFNNHIPLDPDLAQAVAISKVSSKVNVSRGDLVPYSIVINNTLPAPLTDVAIIDNFPAGFKYVKGSARINGIGVEPTINGLQLRWDITSVEADIGYTVDLLLIAGAGVQEGEYVNRAHVYSNITASNISGEANATVRVVPDPMFDCSDVIGKVFDDYNLNGYQDENEPGIAGARVATARGLLITTDKHGRFHVTCAVVPDEQRGSNFILKLDERSLPSGYRVTTENPRVQRVTRGKMARFNFGATVHHVVTLSVTGGVFQPGSVQIRPQWVPRLGLLIEELHKKPSVLRMTYLADVESAGLVDDRLDALKARILEHWKEISSDGLTMETEVFWRHGGPVDDNMQSSNIVDYVSGVFDRSSFGEDTEKQLPPGYTFTPWMQDASVYQAKDEPKFETKQVKEKKFSTKKLKNVVPPIPFKSGKADIPEEFVTKLREVLNGMRDRVNVRLYFIGHTDNVKLRGALKKKYADNLGLSKERAGTTAEFFQRALELPPEAISYQGMGDTNPVASNDTNDGRMRNRRVEVQVWYDEVTEDLVDRKVEIDQETRRIMVCRVETVCKLRYKEGHSRRAKLKNLVPPFHYDEGVSEIPAHFLEQLKQALRNLSNKDKVQMRFIAYTDNIPLTGRDARIYGGHAGLSKANARRVAIAVQEALKLPNEAVSSAGKGSGNPIASNNSEKGRALNRRIEVEFWHDDPLEDLPDEPQLCPDASAAETVERIYSPPEGDIKPIYFENGQPAIPEGYTKRLQRAMEDIGDKGNVRLRFIGYTGNKRLNRRTAMVYGDDIGLSTARARRAMEAVKTQMNLSDEQTEFEGRGYVQSHDVVNTGFIELDRSKVEVQVVYDELELLDDTEGVAIKRITRAVETKNPYALNPMRISVDGQPINDPNKNIPDVQRCTDVALDKAGVQFKFDNLQLKPRLNVTAWPNVISQFDSADTEFVENRVHFKRYTNYPSFIDKAEVRLFSAKQSTRDTPLTIVPMRGDGGAQWQYTLDEYSAPRIELKYVLRVYDKQGNFDETLEQTFWVIDKLETDNSVHERQKKLLMGYGGNRLSVNNIPLNGGTVRVYGGDVPENHKVWFAGQALPIADSGEFGSEFILPEGLHTVEVVISDKSGNGNIYRRDMELEKSDWFYVGIADLTAGQDSTHGPAALVTGNDTHYNNEFGLDGRLAFYVKGKFANDVVLTASADTREGPVDELFSNFMDKSPGALFRRLDLDYYYPTSGDDSTVEEDAPTSGKLYVKLQKENDYGLWGNFNIAYLDNNLAHVDRGLYGANINYESDSATYFGETRFATNLFAAEPGTVAGRDEFRGTGGSLYYVKHQDILTGSERLRIEIRDAVSGLVVGVKNLTQGLDYDIDYLQGRIMLTEALSASAASSTLVDRGNYGGNEIYLVARYEYTPNFDNINELITGGRIHYWFNDRAKFGMTLENQEFSGNETSLNAFDLTLRQSAGTWLKLEQSTSKGPVSSSLSSNDGGYNFNEYALALGTNTKAQGQRVDVSVRLEDFFDGVKGTFTYYNQQLDGGYSAPGLIALTETTQSGAMLQMPLHASVAIKLKTDSKVQADALETKAMELDVDYVMNEHWTFGTGLRNDKRTDNSSAVPLTQRQGERTDLAFRTTYDSRKNWLAYGFMQETTSLAGNRKENGRIGIGGDYRASDRFTLDGELSSGDLGAGVRLGSNYKMTDATNLYTSYTLGNERNGNGVKARNGNLSTGLKSRYSDSASIYMEERYTHGDVPSGLTHALGFDLAVTESLNFGGNIDVGRLRDNNTGAQTNRKALGIKLGYKVESLTYAGALEYRVDETEQANTTSTKRTTWLMKNSIKYQLNPDWRLLGKLNHSESASSLGNFYNGNFTEAVVGYAFRPVRNDALNALFKYTYFYNMPTTGQVALNNIATQYIQKSHILSADVMYDVTKNWTLGGKYAYRFGQLGQDRENPQFFDSAASLYILRADWHFIHRWDALVEGRLLEIPQAGDSRSGILLGIYRHIDERIKMGVGYNFTDFSDDLTDLDYDSQGAFINLIGKF